MISSVSSPSPYFQPQRYLPQRSAAQARITQETFGLRLGPLGIHLRTRQVKIEPDPLQQALREQEEKRTATVFREELAVALEREQLFRAADRSGLDRGFCSISPKGCARAYRHQAEFDEPPLPSVQARV